MSEPLVVCMMLTANRQEMAERAMKAFHAQTYRRKVAVVVDAGKDKFRYSIGHLRNRAVLTATGLYGPDIIVHWDDDDWSHPNRIAEQVAFLQASGADCVGYNPLPFWDSEKSEAWVYQSPNPRYCPATTFCYWRRTWERWPFKDCNAGCDDNHWELMAGQGLKKVAVSADTCAPAMIASIHPGNTCAQIQAGKREWTRRPALDQLFSQIMSL